MASFAQFNNIHFKMGPGDDFPILLGYSDELGHVLHASDWLADLSLDSYERLAAI